MVFSHGGYGKAEATTMGRAYAFSGFRPEGTVRGIFGDPKARIIKLNRRSKTQCADCGGPHNGWYDRTVRRVRDLSCGDTRVYLEFEVRRVLCKAGCKVRRERLEFLADNPLYAKRFAYFVGRRCHQATINDVAKELHLDWGTVKELEKQYMRAGARWQALRSRYAKGVPSAGPAVLPELIARGVKAIRCSSFAAPFGRQGPHAVSAVSARERDGRQVLRGVRCISYAEMYEVRPTTLVHREVLPRVRAPRYRSGDHAAAHGLSRALDSQAPFREDSDFQECSRG
jgi:zinc-finger of transposase IS204/IS1001/IS1096/IS1165